MTARILVVDDDESLRELLRMHLAAAGYEVSTAPDAISAGYQVLKNPPDEDGRKLRPAVCEIVVIFFSGLLSAQRSRCRWRGRCERLHLICHRIALALLGSIAELDVT